MGRRGMEKERDGEERDGEGERWKRREMEKERDGKGERWRRRGRYKGLSLQLGWREVGGGEKGSDKNQQRLRQQYHTLIYL